METGKVKPLSPQQASVADGLAHRLHDEFRELLALLPDTARGGSALSRHLELDRATCQRIVAASKASPPDRHLLVKIPGVRGLDQFVDALHRKGIEEGATAGAEAAIRQYEEFLNTVGGSQARLAARLAPAPRPRLSGLARETMDPTLHRRAALFEAGAAITGRSSEVAITLFAYRPDPSDPDRMEMFTVSGMIGHVAGPAPVPLLVAAGSLPVVPSGEHRDKGYSSLDRSPAHGRTPRVLLEEFSTTPLPLVTSRGPDDRLLQILDQVALEQGRPIDMITAYRPSASAPHPRTESPPVQEAWVLQHYPANHMIFDVFLHRDLARICIPEMSLHLWVPAFDTLIHQRWATRFPDAPPLQILGPGSRSAASPRYPRYVELLEDVFGRVGWPLGEFVGHRCEIDYPVWRGGYCMSFDFSEESEK